MTMLDHLFPSKKSSLSSSSSSRSIQSQEDIEGNASSNLQGSAPLPVVRNNPINDRVFSEDFYNQTGLPSSLDQRDPFRLSSIYYSMEGNEQQLQQGSFRQESIVSSYGTTPGSYYGDESVLSQWSVQESDAARRERDMLKFGSPSSLDPSPMNG